MRLFRVLSFIACAATFLAVAHADTYTGVFYLGVTGNPFPTSAPPTAPTDTFNVSNPQGDIFNFVTGNPSATLDSFLRSGGNTVIYTGGIGGSDPIDNSLLGFNGFHDFAPGTYTINHDGALYLSYAGNVLIDSSDPTAGEQASSFTITSDTGSVYLDLVYGVSTNAAPTPEPGSFILLGSGILAAAGAVRRRLTA